MNHTEKPMMLFTSHHDTHKTFAAMPVSTNTPFANFFYLPDKKALLITGVLKKMDFSLEDKLDSNGHPIEISGKRGNELKKRHAHIHPFQKERLTTEVNSQYYITDEKEIASIIERFCENEGNFDYQKYLDAPPAKNEPTQNNPEQQIAALAVAAGLPVVQE